MNKSLNVIILAAGKGTRLGIDTPKPLLPLQNGTLIGNVLGQVLGLEKILKREINISIIVGHKKNLVIDYINTFKIKNKIEFIYQDQQLGTGHAIQEYFLQTKLNCQDILILCADTPLIETASLVDLERNKLEKNLKAIGLSFNEDNPFGYGRILRHKNYSGVKIVEQKDASPEEQKITEVNSGIYLVDKKYLKEKILNLNTNNKSNEFYLTDIMDFSNPCDFLLADNFSKQFLGVNTMEQLAEAEHISRMKVIKEHLKKGVRIIDLNTTYIDSTVEIESGVTIMPNVHLRGNSIIKNNVSIETGSIIIDSILHEEVQIQPYSIIEKSEVFKNSVIGPFARLRPESKIGANCKIGNFVETKKSFLDEGVKVSHLSYVGDAEIGKNSNIGCGFITCNYDGKNKSKTKIGDNCFIGSDSQMIAPVEIGNNCYVASGSTINQNLKDGDFAISRSRQITKEGMAKKFIKNK